MSDATTPQPSLRKWVSPVRCAAVAISLLALLLVGSRLDHETLLHTLASMNPAWFLAAASAFALSLLLGAWRWHQMLQVTGVAISLPTSLRLTLVGHSFSSLLFGAAMSDIAKATLYSRWFGLPLSRILAASALDRSAGGVSTILYGILTLGAALWAAPKVDWQKIGWRPTPGWLGATGVILLVLLGLSLHLVRGRWIGHWRRFSSEFRGAVFELRARPALSLRAIAAGFLIQLLISAVLGFCLHAIHPDPLPWGQAALDPAGDRGRCGDAGHHQRCRCAGRSGDPPLGGLWGEQLNGVQRLLPYPLR